jgi:hypothetical protein
VGFIFKQRAPLHGAVARPKQNPDDFEAAAAARDDMYHPYHLRTAATPGIAGLPSRFSVRVKRHRLAQHLLHELFHYRHNLQVAVSRPCVYGTFSGPIGGFAPRPQCCVACLRCMVEYPEMAQVKRNPARRRLGDSYFNADFFDTIQYEAETGRVPVKGAGFRGRFGGPGWDGMWTDMSEIVRPTRDGIHGREFISTEIDIGTKPPFLAFGQDQRVSGARPQTFSLPIPFLFDVPAASLLDSPVVDIFAKAAQAAETLMFLPYRTMKARNIRLNCVIPLVQPGEIPAPAELAGEPRMIELAAWDSGLYQALRAAFPGSVLCLRYELGPPEKLADYFAAGVRVFHLAANYHGRSREGRFMLEWVRAAHRTFVDAGCRDEVTLIGSGGIIAAEHIAKAIACGLDAVALDTSLAAALEARFTGKCVDRAASRFRLPKSLPAEWGLQRLLNLLAAWRDQLLEVLGAMGLREVRRLRGEIGRAMFQDEMEAEAFAGIEGYGA